MNNFYKPMICPVCGKYFFSELTEEDIQEGDNGLNRSCHICGWKYNYSQYLDKNLKNEDGFSINDLIRIFKETKDNSNQHSKKAVSKKHLCPVCKSYMFKDKDSFDICPICGWEDDSYDENHPTYSGGVNKISLTDSIKMYQEKTKKESQ